jgi:hypothetical protein
MGLNTMMKTGDRGLMTDVSAAKDGPFRLGNGKFGCRHSQAPAPVPIRLRILTLLQELGPMTARELAEQLKIKHVNQIAAALQGCDHYHISGYRRDEDGGRLYPRALYAYGPGKEAKKPPKLSRQEYNKRSKAKMRKTVSSVWDLGIFYEDRRKHALSNMRSLDVCT